MLLNREELYRCMDEQHLDFVIGSTYQNVYYMTNFFSPNPFWLSGHITLAVFPRDREKEPILVLSKSEVELLTTSQSWVKEFRCYGDAFIQDTGRADLCPADELFRKYIKTPSLSSPIAALFDALNALGMKAGDRVGIDEKGVSAPVLEAIQAEIRNQLIYASSVIGKARLIKTPEEIALLQRSVAITEQSIRASMEQAWVGMSESDMSRIYCSEVCRRGGVPLLTCIGFGSHSAHANAQATEEIRLEKNKPIRFDIGCSYRNYQSDTARIAVIGELSMREEGIFDALREGIRLGIEAVKPGVKYSEVFRIVMNSIQEKLPDYRRSHVGHGIGVEIYDPPVIGDLDCEFRENMVMCVEAPYYEVGLGGYQVEEVIHITANGTRLLSERPVELMRY